MAVPSTNLSRELVVGILRGMDEILIEEKKYVSSKQAAKVTGYAKDYIGQLCREGRVPARLVGRSWYVLESAIQDHRFGDQKIEQKERKKSPASPMLSQTWESPRYEAFPAEVLPPVNRLQAVEEGESATGSPDTGSVAQNLQDSWKAWFDRVADAAPSIPDIIPKKGEENDERVRKEIEVEEEVNVPIRAVYRQPPEELLPRRGLTMRLQDEEDEEEPAQEKQGSRGGSMVVVQLAGAMLAVIMAGLAIIGSGYFDTYIISHTRVGTVAGVELYNR